MPSPSRRPLRVSVPVAGAEYDIWIDTSWDDVERHLKKTFRLDDRGPKRTAIVLFDENVTLPVGSLRDLLVRLGLRTVFLRVPSGEESKSFGVYSRCLDLIAASKADRKSIVVAYGGGVCGDLAGFVAASYLRGVDFVQIPTTLLAAVDSSVGGKTGINIAAGKNLVGAFHQPRGVYVLLDHFRTLPGREWAAGLAEVVKYGVLGDPDFFAYLEQNARAIQQRSSEVVRHVVKRSCELKSDVVQADERETTGRRATLNYGHTFAHAYENLLGYGRLLHGEAVAIGMLHASKLAQRLGRIDGDDYWRQRELINAFGLPTELPRDLPQPLEIDDVIGVMASDKKAADGQLRFILPTRIGHVELVDDVPIDAVRKTLKEAGCV